MKKTIGIFGVTANPPHISHLKAIESASQKVDEIWVSPVFVHPFGKKFIDYEHRLEMLHMLINSSECKNIYVKELDKEFYEIYKDTVYSYKLLKFLQEKHPDFNFKLIIGADNYKPEVWSKFKYNTLIENEFGLIVEKDEGKHSTQIREMLSRNEDVSDYMKLDIIEYMKNHNLYI